MWLYPLPAFLALAGWVFVFVTTDKQTILGSLIALAAGIVSYLVWAAWTLRWPFGKVAELKAP